jgi:hypothetical protein
MVMKAKVRKIAEELIKKTEEGLVTWGKINGFGYETILHSGKVMLSAPAGLWGNQYLDIHKGL